MSIDVIDPTAELDVPSGGYGLVVAGWFRNMDYSQAINWFIEKKAFSDRLLFGNSYGTQTSLRLISDNNGEIDAIDSSYTGWVWGCIVATIGVGGVLYWRKESGTSLSSVTLPATDFDTSDYVKFLRGEFGNIAHMRGSLLRIWTDKTSFSSLVSDLLAESGSTTAIKRTGLIFESSCAIATTIGADTSGNGNNATAVGTYTLNSDEPNISLGAAVTIPTYSTYRTA